MISTPRLRHFQGAALALFGLMAATLAGEQARATRLPAATDLPLTSHIAPDLLRLSRRVGAAAGEPVENIQIGLPAKMMLFDAQGRVGVRVTARDAAALAPKLKALGMQVVACRPDYHLIEGFVSAANLPKLDALEDQGLLGVMAIPKPITRAGSVTSQADFAQEADRVRATNPALNGSGTRIGVLSDSFNVLGGAAAGVASGDLPAAGVRILQEGPSDGSDEGRGMAELIYDIAPGAEMVFGTAVLGEAEFAQMILDLADPAKGNCKVLVDDIGYLAEPFFQDGLISQAIDTVVSEGAAYFSAAGNQAEQGYESDFRRAVDSRTGVVAHDFDPGPGVDTRQTITVPGGGMSYISLQWDDPFYTTSGVDTDLDLQFYQPGTSNLIAEANLNNIGSQTPSEIGGVVNFGANAGTAEVVIRLRAGAAPGRIKYIDFGNSIQNEYFGTGSTILGHPAAKGAMAVGAVDYDDQDHPAYFTSAGPNRILFAPNGMPLSAAEVRSKPDISAIQGTNTTFFGDDADSDGYPNFYGTSAAAPHAAAIAALVWQSSPALTPSALYSRLISTADDSINGPGWDKLTGYGLINAYDAVYGPASAAGYPYSDGLEGGVLSQVYETRTTGAGRIEVTDANGPATGNRHLLLTTSHDGRSGRSEVILHVNAAASSGAVLSFRQREFNDADQPMSANFVGAENSDGVALSVDGVNWYRIASFTGTTSTNTYQLHQYSLAAVAAANGLALSADTRIKFQQYGNLKTPRGGIAIDDISLANLSGISLESNAYQVNERDGSVAVKVLRNGDPSVAIQVNYATTASSATAPEDYTSVTGSLLFQAGETTKSINIPIAQDRLIEGPEAFQLTLSNANGGILLTPSTTTVTILDDQDVVAPSNLTATVTGTTSARLEWTDNSGNEERFQIERKVGAGPFAVLGTVASGGTSYVDTGLTTNVLYTYRVRAVQGSATSNYSNQATVNISPIQLERGVYTVSETAGQVVVRVTRAGDILSASSVRLTTVQGTATADADYTSQSQIVSFIRGETNKDVAIPINADQLLEANESFEVVLSDAEGASATLGDLKRATVTITDGGAAPAPRSLAALVTGPSEVQLSWKDNCVNETAVVVERRSGQGAFARLASLQANSQSYTDSGVVPGIAYTYRVKATFNELETDYSNEAVAAITNIRFETEAYTVLEDDATVSLKVTRLGDPALPVTVKYVTSDDSATAAGGDYSASSATLVFAPGETSKSFTVNVHDDDLLEGAETFKVTLSEVTGAGTVIGAPGVAVVTIADNQVRLTPSSLSASVLSSTSVQLNWTDNSGNESGFEIERRPLGGVFARVAEVATNIASYTDPGLNPNSAYTYRVRAISGAGTSAYSNEASITTLPAAPQAPSGLSAVVQDGGKVRLTWSDHSRDEAGFVVERKEGDGDFEVVASLAENSTTYLDSGRVAERTYTYRVQAINAGGASDYSNVTAVTLSSVPGSPTNLAATAVSNAAIQLSWSVASGSTATRIERQGDAGFELVGTVAQGVSTFVDRSVLANVTYTYRVRASNLSGVSEPSNSVQAAISSQGRIKVTPAKLAFGKVKAGVERTKTFTIKNVGKGSLGGVISGITIQAGGDAAAFSIVSGAEQFNLAPGQTRKVTVRILAGVPGNYQGALSITSTDPKKGNQAVSLNAKVK